MTFKLPEIPPETTAQWQRIVDLVAQVAHVPASLVMWTNLPKHAVFVSSRTEDNPYEVGRELEFNESLYCYGVFKNDGELVIEDAAQDPVWADLQDLNFGMSFYIGYPLKWPGGEMFGTICILDRKRNKHALLFREGLQIFAGVIESNLRLLVEIGERQHLETSLKQSNERLEERVEGRTRELEEANTALRVLLSTAESARREHGEHILRQINTLVIPHVEKIERFLGTRSAGREYLGLVESNLVSLASSLSSKMMLEFQKLTATEVEIAQLVMRGKSTKDIAKMLSRSTSTIDFHRNNIRAKLGLQRNQNLRTYLHSIHASESAGVEQPSARDPDKDES